MQTNEIKVPTNPIGMKIIQKRMIHGPPKPQKKADIEPIIKHSNPTNANSISVGSKARELFLIRFFVIDKDSNQLVHSRQIGPSPKQKAGPLLGTGL